MRHQKRTPMVQSILHGSYWGLGMAMGSGISGVIIDFAGARAMFLTAAGICFLMCMFHLGIDIYNKMKTLEEEQEQRRAAPTRGGEALQGKGQCFYWGSGCSPSAMPPLRQINVILFLITVIRFNFSFVRSRRI
ncbi:hypothetical protein OS493_003606 [Desmophyllum pertusum]|uniref:Uncharacterized protein n=1 Tax=Desmophyllum pertusum TaxID=174260 RepID=A0A9X0A5U7_9CNID|nr:hypothetical protein OS493_003606 [Desmophyllum pertusum]